MLWFTRSPGRSVFRSVIQRFVHFRVYCLEYSVTVSLVSCTDMSRNAATARASSQLYRHGYLHRAPRSTFFCLSKTVKVHCQSSGYALVTHILHFHAHVMADVLTSTVDNNVHVT